MISCLTTSATGLRTCRYSLFLHLYGCSGLRCDSSQSAVTQTSSQSSGALAPPVTVVAVMLPRPPMSLLHQLSICALGPIRSAFVGHPQLSTVHLAASLPRLHLGLSLLPDSGSAPSAVHLQRRQGMVILPSLLLRELCFSYVCMYLYQFGLY